MGFADTQLCDAPYKLVKDVRTSYESTDVDAVMDGEIDAFLKAYLMLMGQKSEWENSDISGVGAPFWQYQHYQ